MNGKAGMKSKARTSAIGTRYGVALVAAALLLASCGGAQQAEVTAEPASQADVDAFDSAEPNDDAQSLEQSGVDAELADDGDEPTQEQIASGGSLGEDIQMRRYTVPFVPPIALPDVSVLSETGSIVEASVGGLAASNSGLDVVSAECLAEGGDLVYNGSDESGSIFDLEADGTGTYDSFGGDDGLVDLTIEPDGSGSYKLVGGDDGNISIQVEADGSGSYEHIGGSDGVTDIVVNADGSGKYKQVGGLGVVEVTLNADGSGQYKQTGGNNLTDDVAGVINLDVNADGSGLYKKIGGIEGVLEIEKRSDGSLRFKETGGLYGVIEIEIRPDGSGRFEQVGGPDGNIEFTVDENGNGTYEQIGGLSGIVKTTFETEIGILDPALLVVGPEPTFAVADQFPSLAKLAPLSPPCATVIRLDANVLFDFDSDQLRPEAAPVVDQVAAALVSSGESLEVHGHTDSKGDDAYNLDLSQRRAAAFASALVSKGVSTDIETTGYGESRPVAPNETADGSDDPAGRQLNRRIEIVIPE